MIFAVDIGNSRVSVGLIEDGRIESPFSFATKKEAGADELGNMIREWLADRGISANSISCAIISSVVPELDKAFKKAVTDTVKRPALFVDSSLELGINVKMPYPEKVGADRLVNASAAYAIFGDDVIVVDLGTATTFDYVTKSGDLIGGVIAPGVNVTHEALIDKASKLDAVKIARPEKVIGIDTGAAITSGIYFGYIGLINNIISEMKMEARTGVKVIATGGAFHYFKDDLKIIDIYDEHLSFKGLHRIYELNKHVLL